MMTMTMIPKQARKPEIRLLEKQDDTNSVGSDNSNSNSNSNSNNNKETEETNDYKKSSLLLLVFMYGTICTAIVYLANMGVDTYKPEIKETLNEAMSGLYNDSYRYLEENYGAVGGSVTVDNALKYFTEEEGRIGHQLVQQSSQQSSSSDSAPHTTVKPKYPIVFIPGFVTSGLVIWGGKPCARKHFRKRIWTTAGSVQAFMNSPKCWLEHMALDPFTGLDPDGIRLRAAEGMEAADYFFGPFWVFGKIIENLADIGYDTSNMSMQPYDWRLSFPLMEQRDGYFTKLKRHIEAFHETTGEKVILTSHSMGAVVVHFFMAWVTHGKEQGGGGGGEMWVDEHIHAYVNIAGPHLGLSKAATALLSGEMSDTAIFLGRFADMLENLLARRVRKDLWTTWGSLWAMLPRGGDQVWGTGADICDKRSTNDPFCPEEGNTPFIVMNHTGDDDVQEENDKIECKVVSVDGQVERTPCEEDSATATNPMNDFIQEIRSRETLSTYEVLSFLQKWGGGQGPDTAHARLHAVADREETPSYRSWHDPTVTPLPHAPNLRIYCVYGHGIPTERSYYYRRGKMSGSSDTEVEPPIVMANQVDMEDINTTRGVRYSDGDGSIPLLSMGYLCADAWQREDSGLNSHGVKVTTREYLNQYEFQVNDPMRSGPKGGEHCDILGNDGMLGDLLRVATDFDVESVNRNKFSSDILEISKRMKEWGGGIYARK